MPIMELPGAIRESMGGSYYKDIIERRALAGGSGLRRALGNSILPWSLLASLALFLAAMG